MTYYVILDRDGTVTVERGDYIVDPSQIELILGSAVALRRLRDLGLGLVVVTNQSAVGRRLLDRETLDRIHARMKHLLASEGVVLDGIYVCHHRPDENCRCRKPGTELVERAARELGFDPKSSYVVGDKASDIEMGTRLKATTILLRTGYGKATEAAGLCSPTYVVDDLHSAVPVIERQLKVRE